MTIPAHEVSPHPVCRRWRARVGCSGWSYQDWTGPVYPTGLTPNRWFGHYNSLFDRVELNSTFYGLPTPQAVDGWAAAASPGFVFAMKFGQFGSHRMKLSNAQSWLPNHVECAQRLGASGGLVELMLPTRHSRSRQIEM